MAKEQTLIDLRRSQAMQANIDLLNFVMLERGDILKLIALADAYSAALRAYAIATGELVVERA